MIDIITSYKLNKHKFKTQKNFDSKLSGRNLSKEIVKHNYIKYILSEKGEH